MGLSACGDDSTSTAPLLDMGADTNADADTDTNVDSDTVAPAVSITSGLRSTSDGNYRLEGIALDNRGLASLSYTIDGAAQMAIAPLASPFSVDLSLGEVANILVSATDAAGNQGTASITVTRAAVAALTADFTVSSETSTFSPTLVDAMGSFDPQGRELTYTWDFGDTAVGTGVAAGHLYAATGTYTIKLVVSTPDGDSDEISHDIVVADPTATAFATLDGIIVDPQGSPLRHVSVVDREGQVLTASDDDGHFSIMAGTGIPLVFTFQHGDYTTQVLRTQIEPGQSAVHTPIRMMRRSFPVFLMNAEAGGTVEGPMGSRIEFPANSLVDETGAAITGPVAVTLTPVDLGSSQSLASPGLFAAFNANGSTDRVVSYGLMEVTLTQDGQNVELAPNVLATVEVPYTAAQGQAGTMFPFGSLDKRTGYWNLERAAAPVQTASSGSGLVQRVEVGHFSWLNILGLADDPNPSISDIPIEFESNGVVVTEAFQMDLEFKCLEPGKSSQRFEALKSGDLVPNIYKNCDVRVRARSTSGRYFADTIMDTGGGTVSMTVDVIDAESVPVLSPGTPQQGALQANGRVFYAVNASALSDFEIRFRSIDAGLRGTPTLIPPSRIEQPVLGFGSVVDTHVYGSAVEAGLWLVAVEAQLGSGDFEIELLADPTPSLKNNVTQTFLLPARATRDLVIHAAPGELVRVLVSSNHNVLLDVDGDLNSGDTGLFRFENDGASLLKIRSYDLGVDATITVTYAVSAPALAVTSAHLSLQRALRPAEVGVFILPHFSNSGVIGHIKNAIPAEVAPDISIYTGNETSFPNPSLQTAQKRNLENTEAIAALLVPAVANENTHATFLHVSTHDHVDTDYEIEFDRALKSNAITVGTCQGAHTASVTAAAIALTNNGTITLCPEDHQTFAGLRFSQARFTLKGIDRTLSRLVSWPSSLLSAVNVGTYPGAVYVPVEEATFEDLSIVNRSIGIYLDRADISINRVDIGAAAPLVDPGFATKCIYTDGTNDGSNSFRFTESTCTNTEDGLVVSNFGDADVSNSVFTTSKLGVDLNGVTNSLVVDNVFTGAVKAIASRRSQGLNTFTGNTITQGITTTGGDAVSLALFNQTASVPPLQSVIGGNTIMLSGLSSVGVSFGFDAGNGEILIDGNKIVGTKQSQTGVRGGTSSSNIYGGVVRIQNNVLRDLGRHAVHVPWTDMYSQIGLYNNSVKVDINAGFPAVFYFTTKTNGATASVDLFNNILMGAPTVGWGVLYASSLTLVRDNNLFFQIGTPYTASLTNTPAPNGPNDIVNMDPLFVNDDLMLDPLSPAVDAGTSAGVVPLTAYGGVARPIGLGNDIGAHEQ